MKNKQQQLRASKKVLDLFGKGSKVALPLLKTQKRKGAGKIFPEKLPESSPRPHTQIFEAMLFWKGKPRPWEWEADLTPRP